MSILPTDHQPQPAGGFFVHPENPGRNEEALLVLSDGSVWRGRSIGSTTAASGDVRLVGSLAAVGETGLLSGFDLKSFKKHVSTQFPAGEGVLRGCLTAAGATYPLHATVALAVARGEIGRPSVD